MEVQTCFGSVFGVYRQLLPGSLQCKKQSTGVEVQLLVEPIKQEVYIFFASSKNLANPISVSGCFKSPSIESSGQVQTCAPASAERTM